MTLLISILSLQAISLIGLFWSLNEWEKFHKSYIENFVRSAQAISEHHALPSAEPAIRRLAETSVTQNKYDYFWKLPKFLKDAPIKYMSKNIKPDESDVVKAVFLHLIPVISLPYICFYIKSAFVLLFNKNKVVTN